MKWFIDTMPGFFVSLMTISLVIAAVIYQFWLIDVL